MLQVVGDEVGALKQQVDVVGRGALDGVLVGRDPGGVLGGGPVQLGRDGAAELRDLVLDGLVEFREALVRRQLGRLVVLVTVRIRIVVLDPGIGARGPGLPLFLVIPILCRAIVICQDDAVLTDVIYELRGEGYYARLDT